MFIVQKEDGKIKSPSWAKDFKLYYSLGPFINVGGGDVPKSSHTYIDLYGMKGLKNIFSTCLMLSFLMVSTVLNAEEVPCAKSQRVSGPCFIAKGYITVSADMWPRLIVAKTGEMIRIARSKGYYDGDFMWPKEIDELINPNTDVEAKFMVCPFRRPANHDNLRTMCIAKATHIHTEPSGN